jgi:hypothetical protein
MLFWSPDTLPACLPFVAAAGDVAILSPVVAALEKGEVLNLLPRLLQVNGRHTHCTRPTQDQLSAHSCVM